MANDPETDGFASYLSQRGMIASDSEFTLIHRTHSVGRALDLGDRRSRIG
ncbi:hypothetical protein RTCIAT899_PC01830 (plasmid) [Rhizobium tropici CIAT 899]|nr:hypothetical protein RTCIAT899_PC01830 [Rhizobium tropici CIAT 899]